MTTKIMPTIGRVVLFWPPVNSADPDFTCNNRSLASPQPMAALVSYVWNDGLVNLSVMDHNGIQHGRTSVPLIQEGEPKPEDGFFCCWMPYQIGQAKKDAT